MRATLVLALVAALGGCSRRARVEVTPVPLSKPPRAIVRCRTTGLDVTKVTWKVGPAVHQQGYNVPRDEAAALFQWGENAPPAQLGIACTAEDAKGNKLSASTSLATPTITKATVSGAVLSIEGSGLGTPSGDEDGVWLRGRDKMLRADWGCKTLAWDDHHIAACTPVGATGTMEVRVATGGKLALGTVEVKP